jgi:hypothetical protein
MKLSSSRITISHGSTETWDGALMAYLSPTEFRNFSETLKKTAEVGTVDNELKI